MSHCYILSPHTGTGESLFTSSQSGIPWNDLQTLLELNPPAVMPHGNVGTPTSVFMDLIQQCKLPGRIIKKLNLEFPKTRSKRRYGAVGLDYGGEVKKGGGEGETEERRECEGRDKESGYNDEEEEEELDVIPSVSFNTFEGIIILLYNFACVWLFSCRMMIMMLRSGSGMRHSMTMLISR